MVSTIRSLTLLARERFPVARTRNLVHALARIDRPQGSKGLAEAAKLAHAAFPGLKVQQVLLPRDGEPQWWTFRATRGWSPVEAHLGVPGLSPCATYAAAPCFLAAGSTALTPAVRRLLIWPDVDAGVASGAVVLVRKRAELQHAILSTSRNGVAAIITDAFCSVDRDTGAVGVGRLEVPPGFALCLFSVTHDVANELIDKGGGWVECAATIVVDSSPAVSAVATRPDPSANVLLTAHLCHRLPGANDNASGVATILGAAAVLPHLTSRSVGVLCAPEIVGSAWWAHTASALGVGPRFVLNADTVAASEARCGRELEVEPGLGPTLPLAAIVLAAAHACIPNAPCSLVATAFVGASDHGLFASADWRPDVASLTNFHDRFNHTSLDLPETLDWARLHHAGTLIASTAAFLCGVDDKFAAETLYLAEQWIWQRLKQRPTPSPLEIRTWTIDVAELLDKAEQSLSPAARGECQCRADTLVDSLQRAYFTQRDAICGVPLTAETWRREVDGPFNLYALVERLEREEGAGLLAKVRRDKSWLGLLIALHVVLRGNIERSSIHDECEAKLGQAIPEESLSQALRWLKTAGWCSVQPSG